VHDYVQQQCEDHAPGPHVDDAAAAMVGVATPASAHVLQQTATCKPGQKWDTSRPVKVRLLGDSALDYLNTRGGGSTFTDLVRLDADVEAVIALYNAIPGSSLELRDHR
jgi:hypothetical protein